MDRFGVDPSISGDIVERASGRSRLWICRQAMAAIALTTVRDVRSRPRQALAAMLVGWGSVLLFFTFGDGIANAPGKIIWNWTVEHGWDGFRAWWFGHVAGAGQQFLAVSYFGFAFSGWIVGRFARPTLVVAYATSVWAILSSVEAWFEYVNRPVIVPRTLFYALAPSLPFLWRSGLVLIPFVVLIGGFVGLRRAFSTHRYKDAM
jgi:hypothetical protein